MKYGDRSGIEIANDEGRGFEVTVRIEERRDPRVSGLDCGG